MRINSKLQILAVGICYRSSRRWRHPQAWQFPITIGPPALPVYVQPPCPTEGYLWNPGYWAYGPDGYYWVPGVWVAPPRVGVLWIPPAIGASAVARICGTPDTGARTWAFTAV